MTNKEFKEKVIKAEEDNVELLTEMTKSISNEMLLIRPMQDQQLFDSLYDDFKIKGCYPFKGKMSFVYFCCCLDKVRKNRDKAITEEERQKVKDKVKEIKRKRSELK